MKIYVEHSGYGCDTGCCGHVVTMEDDSGRETEKFHFEHPGTMAFNSPRFILETDQEFARWLVEETCGAEHVADLDWDNCFIVSD